jgi:hypothetical protein
LVLKKKRKKKKDLIHTFNSKKHLFLFFFNDKISFATPGDLIKFIPISQDDHKHILNNLGSYKIDSEVFNG